MGEVAVIKNWDLESVEMRKVLAGVASVGLLFFLVSYSFMRNNLSNIAVSIFGDAMDWRSKRLAGRKGIDCGRVRLRQNPTAATNCALQMQAERKPFRVRYDIQGFDSTVSGGVVRTPDDQVYALMFDGDPMGQGGTSLWRQAVVQKPCPQPIHLWVNPKGRITCFHELFAPSTDITSPNVEPY